MNRLRKEATKTAVLERQVAKLEKQCETLERQLAQSKGRQFRLPTGRKTRSTRGSFTRFVIPDTHGCVIDKRAIAAVFGDMETVQPQEIVMLGDHLECGGFLAQHHVIGYVAQTEYTFEDDVGAANQLLDRIQAICPKASVDYIEGNHERRIENWCVTQSQKNRADAEMLRRTFSTQAVLGLEQRKIRFIRQGQKYDGLPIPATIRKGKCYFTHGTYTGQHAASQHVKKFGGNVCYGHTHRADSYMIRTVQEGAIGGWSPGCLCELQPLWQHTNPTDWTHGYAIQLVNPDGTFLHINVPIIDGKSYFAPLIRIAGA